jgi:hypothetical protein
MALWLTVSLLVVVVVATLGMIGYLIERSCQDA